MTEKKTVKRGASRGRPDLFSKKRSGTVNQSLRLTVDDNKLVRKAAKIEGLSINLWASRAVTATARQVIAAASTKE
jgi:uncharacterized protein (DUF1778 family)